MDCREAAYLQALLGTPWQKNGLHCWALVVQIEHDLFGRELPLMRACVPQRGERRSLLSQEPGPYGWREIAHPEHGAVVRMHRIGGNPADLEHAGVFVDGDGGFVVHTDHPHGVVFDTLADLQHRGWTPRFFVPLA